MLLGLINAASEEGGLTEKTRETIWDFAHDWRTIDELNLLERLDYVRRALQAREEGPDEAAGRLGPPL